MKDYDGRYLYLLKEAVEAEEAYKALPDRRHVTNDIAFRRNSARKALWNYFAERRVAS